MSRCRYASASSGRSTSRSRSASNSRSRATTEVTGLRSSSCCITARLRGAGMAGLTRTRCSGSLAATNAATAANSLVDLLEVEPFRAGDVEQGAREALGGGSARHYWPRGAAVLQPRDILAAPVPRGAAVLAATGHSCSVRARGRGHLAIRGMSYVVNGAERGAVAGQGQTCGGQGARRSALRERGT